MAAGGTSLRDFYQQELEALRDRAVEFGRDYPAVAQALGLDRAGVRDPHVELLIQSFAFLTGRLQYQMEADTAVLPNSLMDCMYPHLNAPVPSALVAQIDVKPDGANFADNVSLPRGRYLFATARNDDRQTVSCRFRTCYDTPLWPLEIADIRLTPTNEYDFLAGDPDVHSVLRVRIRGLGTDPIQALPLRRLRFFINPEDVSAYRLYELLAVQLHGMAVLVKDDPKPRHIAADGFRWLGFDESEAALPAGLMTHPGHRLLQEYFAFPEKFLFFEAGGIDASGATREFDLLFLLRATLDKTQELRPAALRLNCVPLVNLFSQRIDPVALDQAHYEYRLTAELQNHRHCEIYAVEELVSIRPDASPRRLAPFFAIDDFARLEKQDYFYVTRRMESTLRSVPGTETYVSFLDPGFRPSRPTDEAIGGRALCTNRRLPEQLRAGAALQLEGAGPVNGIKAVTTPSAHQTPVLLGAQPWSLVSQLLLNHLSLAQDPYALAALRGVLRLHAGRAGTVALRQIDSLVEVSCRPVTRHVRTDAWRGFVQGTHVHLVFDRQHFEGGSPVLFASVLRHFYALYAAVNAVTEVSVATTDTKGNLIAWPPLAGAQAVL